ncbi:uncharacterized protein LOC106663800 [Cimex lectularius]|uniref:Uncharacterized protein n=1 Tax=Cimex lectularius TaxID=79782 RepID=A0A8I6RFM8_CIMLE|nr:uncharacterized protein LOC106663800 [Cimex lectularius]
MPKRSDDQDPDIESMKDEISELAEDIHRTLDIGKSSQENTDELPIFEARVFQLNSAFEKFVSLIAEIRKELRRDKMPYVEFMKLKAKVQTEYYETLAFSIKRNSPSRNTTLCSNLSAGHLVHLKLPSLELPIFDGDLSKWTPFKDTYVSLIHTNVDLMEVQKFHYLKSCLKGSAAQVISAIEISEANYTQTWEALVKKYDRNRIRAMNHLTHLFNFKPMTKLTCETLENFSAIVLENCNAFRKMQLPDSVGFVLYTFALRLLDSKTRKKIENRTP